MKKVLAAFAALAASTPGFFACNGSTENVDEDEIALGDNLPCNVETILKAKCQSCHAEEPLYGAPLALMTYEDTQTLYKDRMTWRAMKDAVESGKMPQGTQLTAEEKDTLADWFAYGARGVAKGCGDGAGGSSGSGGSGGSSGQGAGGTSGGAGTGGAAGGQGGAAGTAGGGGKGGTGGAGGSAGKGGAGGSAGNPTCTEGEGCLPCEVTHRFLAHAPGSSDKYSVPNPTRDSYVCFNFNNPFAAGELGTAMGNIIDDKRVIHHWILFGSQNEVAAGSITTGTSCQLVTANTHITGWAPGGNNTVLPDDIGMDLNYKSFTLQVHYNNTAHAGAADASGVAFCSTKTPRANVAGIVTLGTTSINIGGGATNATATGTCNNLSTDGTPLTVIGTSPHMHLLGTAFRTEHMRGGQSQGDLSNVPLGTWSFEQQRHYSLPSRRTINANDVLRTTCTYNNPNSGSVRFGPRTSDEMCYDFITVYPYNKAIHKCGPAI
ncbi:MAG TPA: hypothetical protein VK524_26375 [Polyangiaceae bacterium]|nr:hypothetical protein [Polyangiaceae bacterium]